MTIFAGRRDFPVCPPGFTSIDEVHQQLVKESVARTRELIQLPPSDLPCPKLVTHVDYHLDEAWADLLLRAFHADDDTIEFIYELVQRDRALSFSLHPQIHNAMLLGIGGEESAASGSSTEVFIEYVDGVRKQQSTSQLVIDRKICPVATNLVVVDPIIKEVNRIDQHGDKSGGEHHLGRLIKSLHQVNTLIDGNLGRISAFHKEAVLLACLSSVAQMLGTGELSLSQSATSDAVLVSWQRYKEPRGWVFGSDTGVKYIEEVLSRPHAGTGILSLRNVAFALSKNWSPELADYVLYTIFESLMQLQYDFEQASQDMPHIERCHRGGQSHPITLERYKKHYEEKLPHRARLNYYNVKQEAAIIILYDPYVMNTAIFPGRFLEKATWEKFVAAVIAQEPDRWHATQDVDTGRTDSLLNGTRAHQEMTPTDLKTAKAFADILGAVIAQLYPQLSSSRP